MSPRCQGCLMAPNIAHGNTHSTECHQRSSLAESWLHYEYVVDSPRLVSTVTAVDILWKHWLTRKL